MTASTWAGLAVAGLLLVGGVSGAHNRLRLADQPAEHQPPGGPRSAWARRTGQRTTPLILAAVAGTAFTLEGPVAAGLGLVAAGTVAIMARGRRTARLRQARLAAVAGCAAALAAELRAGRSVLEAMDAVSRATTPELSAVLAEAVRTARLGGDPSDVLALAGRTIAGLDYLAVCLRVAGASGARLADVTEAVADEVQERVRAAEELAVQLAAPRASAALLAGLPVVGLAMGHGIGADPVHFLLHTAPGAAVLAAGVGLELAGLAWTGWLIRRSGEP